MAQFKKYQLCSSSAWMVYLNICMKKYIHTRYWGHFWPKYCFEGLHISIDVSPISVCLSVTFKWMLVQFLSVYQKDRWKIIDGDWADGLTIIHAYTHTQTHVTLLSRMQDRLQHKNFMILFVKWDHRSQVLIDYVKCDEL